MFTGYPLCGGVKSVILIPEDTSAYLPKIGQIRHFFQERIGNLTRRTVQEEQARLRMQELADLKIPPRERAANRLLLARAQRLFAETTGPRHNAAVRVLLALDKAIAQQTPEMEMARLRRKIGSLLDDLERAGEEELSGFFADEPEDDLPEGWEGEED